MKRASIVAVFAWAIVISGARAFAQHRPAEIGIGVSGVATFPTIGGDIRLSISVPVSERNGIEAFVGPYRGTRHDSGWFEGLNISGFYGFLVRTNIDRGARPGVQPFMTFGGVGFVNHNLHEWCSPYPDCHRSTTQITPPIVGLAGGGVQYTISPHFALRVEVQGLVYVIVPAGGRASISAVVPLGKYATKERGGR